MWCKYKVDSGGSKRISRGTIEHNEGLLAVVIQHVGSRVGVDTLYFHVEALYKIMNLPADSILSVTSPTVCIPNSYSNTLGPFFLN